MGKKATDAELGRYSRVEGHLRGMLTTGKRPAKQTIERLQAIADDVPDPLVGLGFEAMYTPEGLAPCWVQYLMFKLWNHLFDLGFEEKYIDRKMYHFLSMADSTEEEDLDPHWALCWTLDSIEETIQAHLTVLRMVYGDTFGVNVDLPDDEAAYSIMRTKGFQPRTLNWRRLNVDCPVNERPSDVPRREGAGLEVFSFACYHRPFMLARDANEGRPFLMAPDLSINDGLVPFFRTAYGHETSTLVLSAYGVHNFESDVMNVRLLP